MLWQRAQLPYQHKRLMGRRCWVLSVARRRAPPLSAEIASMKRGWGLPGFGRSSRQTAGRKPFRRRAEETLHAFGNARNSPTSTNA